MKKYLSLIYSLFPQLFIEDVLLTLKVYLLFVLVGTVLFIIAFQDPHQFKQIIQNVYGDILQNKNQLTYLSTFWLIFKRNLLASLITICLGIIYRYLPLIIIALNGFLLGFISVGIITFGVSIFTLIFSLLPHGIFEIPALLFAGGLGLYLSKKSQPNSIKGRINALINAKSIFSLIVLLLIIAAMIESYLIVSQV